MEKDPQKWYIARTPCEIWLYQIAWPVMKNTLAGVTNNQKVPVNLNSNLNISTTLN